jgi:transposase InsO family protein
MTLHSLQLVLAVLSGWLNEHQAHVVDYLREENRLLKQQLRGQRLRLSDDDRRRLAAKGVVLGRKLLAQVATIVTPETIIAWHRKLVGRALTVGRRSPGRPQKSRDLAALVVKIAKENPSWGYDRLEGALKNLGHVIAPTTIRNILHRRGLEPAPFRKPKIAWKTFLKAHWSSVAAADFFTTEVWTSRGLVTFYTLFVIDLATRVVHIAGTTTSPDTAFVKQIARNLTDMVDGFLNTKRLLILDRDIKFLPMFGTLKDAGIRVLRCPYRAPNANAYAERFVRSIKSECLDRMIFFGVSSLHRAIAEYVEHYHAERNHQGLENAIIQPGSEVGLTEGRIPRRQRLGGMLNYYYRRAA